MTKRAIVIVSGLPTNINRADGVFDIDVEQWVGATKKIESFPARFTFPNSPRFTNKPVPAKGKPISVIGYLAGIERNEDKSVNRFLIDIESITFLGSSRSAPVAEESPEKLREFLIPSLTFIPPNVDLQYLAPKCISSTLGFLVLRRTNRNRQL